jgi:hypothetical protein
LLFVHVATPSVFVSAVHPKTYPVSDFAENTTVTPATGFLPGVLMTVALKVTFPAHNDLRMLIVAGVTEIGAGVIVTVPGVYATR